jgi:glyoxylase-like metal-dependent hydrolase (beta-lactamase superfamily II)
VRTADPAARGLSDADFPRVKRIADGVYTYEQLRSAGEERFTTVSMFVVTDEGVLVADGQGNEAETRRLVETIAGITSTPITHVVVCSDHGDHTGGNAAFPANATFIAHPTSAALLEQGAARRGRGAGAVTGTESALRYRLVDDSEVIRLGGREIRVLFLGRAHTGGDLVVHLPREKVLFMSEADLNRVFPAMRSAYPSEWLAMLDAARAMDIDVYVPGHGFVDEPGVLEEELDAYRAALTSVIDEAKRLHAAGLSVDEAVERADFGELESWSLRASQGPIAIRRVYMELNGELR